MFSKKYLSQNFKDFLLGTIKICGITNAR